MAESLLIQLVVFLLAGRSASGQDGKKLARRIKNGDHAAFKAFFEEHYDPLYRFLISRGTDREAAEDLIQKAFIYIWEHRDTIDPAKSLGAYLFRIGYTRMLNHFRDHAKFDESAEMPELEASSNPEEEARAKELRNAIENAVKQMPEKRGLVFEMCFMREFTYRETAEELGVSRKTVENHMGLALKDIRKALDRFV